jgi:hypothetical protein
MSKNPKVIETDDGTFVWCSHEKDYKPSDMFSTMQNGRYSYFCFDCKEKISSNKKHIGFDPQPHSKKVLELLGYDNDSQETVHQQFMKKHNLK